ncbi:MAG: hypothetical protein LBH57_08250 [Treponema sp.]|jgi:hypothetical protein|nr:hypothetical protein [Treponema sp.]
MGNRPFRRAGLALLLFSSASFALGLGGREKERKLQRAEENVAPQRVLPAPGDDGSGPAAAEAGEAEERRVRVSGRVRLVGTGLFPQLVISGEEREWYIDKEEESKLLEFQQQLVTVEGRESYKDLTFANGFPAGRRYTLRDIRLTGKD